jgi:8-oxo-dGTP pyrophosphatase MutT (NUDIX family)
MTRDDVRPLLLAREPADEKEHADRQAMLGFLDELPNPFSRDQPRAHFTASALVVDPPRTRTALVHHRKLGIWVQPGGHLDSDDPSYEAAALREVREETGLAGTVEAPRPLHLDVHTIPDPPHLHLDIRLLVVADGDLIVSDESHEVRWLDLADARSLGDASVARLIAALESAQATPQA